MLFLLMKPLPRRQASIVSFLSASPQNKRLLPWHFLACMGPLEASRAAAVSLPWGQSVSLHLQVRGVLDAMPSTNLKPENEDEELEADMVYRTTYMFSATMPPAVERLARKYMRRPVVVNIGSAGKATDNVAQVLFLLRDPKKDSS